MSYSLVDPERFTDEHRLFIERFGRTIDVASSASGAIAGAKDVHSRHLTANDAYGRIVGLPRGGDVAGRMDRDMPCDGTAAFADCFVREDRRLLDSGDIGALKSVLNIHEYDTGLGALVFDKFLLKHHPSKSVLGLIYCAYHANLERFAALFPSYWSQFGSGCSIERTECGVIDGVGQFSTIEYEVAFLLTLGYDATAIPGFLRRSHFVPDASVDAALRAIGDKMAIVGIPITSVRDRLIEARVHQRMPTSLFDTVIGPRT
ncbi:MAG: hypothetical protein ACTHNZ_11960 [Trinickia sp.]|uniref:hypothetical protein n=1 Tax=Trinickia sp. TaxID=2571163 RepID=UPI003F7E7B58